MATGVVASAYGGAHYRCGAVDSVRAALDWVDAIDADLGGTEMLPPLNAATTHPPALAGEVPVVVDVDNWVDDGTRQERGTSEAEAARPSSRPLIEG